MLLRTCAAFVTPVAVLALVPSVALAQQITTAIQGQVTNESGAPIPGAQVTVTDTRTGNTQEYTTNAQGLFSAQNLTTGGPYTISATASGEVTRSPIVKRPDASMPVALPPRPLAGRMRTMPSIVSPTERVPVGTRMFDRSL